MICRNATSSAVADYFDSATNLTTSANASSVSRETSGGHNDQAEGLMEISAPFVDYVYLCELIVGFVLQLFNLRVLNRRKIRSVTYSRYLRALSLTFLLVIIILFYSTVRLIPGATAHAERHSYLMAFYLAHIEEYLINVLLFSSNIIVCTIAAENYLGLLDPLRSLKVTHKHSAIVLAVIYTFTVIILLPLSLVLQVVGPDCQGWYQVTISIYYYQMFGRLRLYLGALFESGLLILVTAVYIAFFWRFSNVVLNGGETKQLMRNRHTYRVRKGVLICLGSLSAYVISNFLSALYELLQFVSHVSEHWLPTLFVTGTTGAWFQSIANLMLMSNFSLAVILQYTASVQYRSNVSSLFRKTRRKYFTRHTLERHKREYELAARRNTLAPTAARPNKAMLVAHHPDVSSGYAPIDAVDDGHPGVVGVVDGGGIADTNRHHLVVNETASAPQALQRSVVYRSSRTDLNRLTNATGAGTGDDSSMLPVSV